MFWLALPNHLITASDGLHFIRSLGVINIVFIAKCYKLCQYTRYIKRLFRRERRMGKPDVDRKGEDYSIDPN